MIYSLTVTNTIGESLTFELSDPWKSGYAIKSINGVGTPDMNVNTTPYGIGDGSVLGSIKAEYRLITISLWPLAKPTVETARQRLYRFFQIKKDILLTFNTENRIVTIDGYVQKIEPSIFENPEGIDIEIKCVDPYFHKMVNDQTKFYGIAPKFEFIFSCEYENVGQDEWLFSNLPVSGTYEWKDLVYAHNRFVSIGYRIINPELFRYVVLYSNDGIEWREGSLPVSDNCRWQSIAYGNETFVTVASGRSEGAYSLNGSNWVEMYLPEQADWFKVVYGGDRFVVMASDKPIAAYSSNGRIWIPTSLPDTGIWKFLTYGNNLYLAVTQDGNQAIYSYDAENWFEFTLPREGIWSSLLYANGRFILLPNDADVGLYSDDGLNWYEMAIPKPANWSMLIYDGEKYIAFSYFESYFMTSVDGGIWEVQKGPDSLSASSSFIYADGKYVMLMSQSSAYYIPPSVVYTEPIEFSEYTEDNRMEIDYQGEVDAGIKITIECRTPPGDIVIYNVDTLEYIQIFSERIEAVSGAPLGPRDIIEINTQSGNKYVRLLRNGLYYNILGAMNRAMTWFVLKQGPNVFTYTTSDEHAAIVMSFSYQDTYAAI